MPGWGQHWVGTLGNLETLLGSGLNLVSHGAVVLGAGKGKGLQSHLSEGEHGKMSGFVCAGWYMDWIWVQTQPDSLSGLASLASWEELGQDGPVLWQLAGWDTWHGKEV